MSYGIVEQCSKRLITVRQQQRDFAPNRHINHVCSRQECAPINELLCIQQNWLPRDTMVLAPYVFLCRYGVVHVCTQTTCTRYMENPQGVCPISGISYGHIYQTDYDKEDSRTWYQTPQTAIRQSAQEQRTRIVRQKRSRSILSLAGDMFAPPPPPQKKEEEEEEEPPPEPLVKKKKVRVGESARARIRQIIESLLFSSVRDQFNEVAIRENNHQLKKERDRYLSRCREVRQIPNFIDICVLTNYYARKPLPLLNITMDTIMLNYYIGIVYQIWEKVNAYLDDTQSSIKISLDSVTLGALYALREGLSAHGLDIIPKDKVLCQRGVLPLINDINHFGFAKKKVTAGEKLIVAAYDNALRLNVSRDDLLINFSLMEEQNAEPVEMFAVGKERPRHSRV